MKNLRGFAIVAAIFILVVLSALGAFILSISSQQQIGSALDVQGVRAYQAARAGLEWGLYRQLQSVPASCSSTATFQLPATATTLSGFYVTVTCTASAVTCNTSTSISATEITAGYTYRINAAGTTSFTAIGAGSNSVGTDFIARGAGTGTGTAYLCEPVVHTITATACNDATCPNTTAPGNLYIERRLSVTF